jgi:hypothetical protein
MDCNLAEYNLCLEKREFDGIPSQLLFRMWVWDLDPNEEIIPEILFNTNNLVGLLYCRCKGLSSSLSLSETVDAVISQDKMQVSTVQPRNMTLQQLSNTVDNFCVEWPEYLICNPVINDSVFSYIDQCVQRFGVLASVALDGTVMNDEQQTEPYENDFRVLTKSCIRRFLNKFMIIYRHFHLYKHVKNIPNTPFNCNLRSPHIQASMDVFHVLCMHFFIPVAGRFQYKADFKGMFNHISQVAYYFNPKYERRQRMPLEDLHQTGDPIQLLPALLELHPEMPIVYEEDHFIHLKKWMWLVVAGRVYLIDPEGTIYYSENITSLFEVYKSQLETT